MSRASRGTLLFGRSLREIRRKRGLTQATIAERVGSSQSHISSIEWGRRVPNLVMLIRLAVALDCRMTDLMRAFDATNLRSMLRVDATPEML